MRLLSVLLISLFLLACTDQPWNSPYPEHDADLSVVYRSFDVRPKHLDPVRSYAANEYEFLAQIYEPPLQYHFLKRPYELTTATASRMPEVIHLDEEKQPLSGDYAVDKIAFSDYLISIKKDIKYQPHPAFAKNESGDFLYHQLTQDDVESINRLADFEITGSRELTADDYIYQIKRLADRELHSPIASLLQEYILGFAEFSARLKKIRKEKPEQFINLDALSMQGVEKVDDYTFRVRLKGVYPQFKYWLAMSFFAPMPWEADQFYSQELLKEKNIKLDWYPIGTGPFMLTENNPNLRMVMEKNPNFHGELYPTEGEPGDAEKGLLDDAGKTLPLIDKAIYSLEKETIPYWNKFLQGYYDTSGVASDSFDQAVQFNAQGDANLTQSMQDKGIKLQTAVSTTIYYMAFNMLDPVVGGDTEQARLLRRAISIAMDYEEFISIFRNGRGVAGQGPLPPGIFGADHASYPFNPYVYDKVNGKIKRKPVSEARKLMKQAGYADGKDPKTGKPLLLNFESTATGPDGKALLSWIRKQFAKLGIQLVIRSTDYNRFQEKIRKGTAQMYWMGWNADYPDPENFFFLLYGKNARVKFQGQNDVNYSNPEFDALFEKMKNMENSPERKQIIDRMVDILRRDAPWGWGFYPKSFALFHSWYGNVKPNLMANNTLKYKRVDAKIRQQKRNEWNQPITWPLWVLLFLLVVSVIPAIRIYRQHEKRTAR